MDFWSIDSLQQKIDLWKPSQISQFFLPFLRLQSNEIIYDVGSGFSPLGLRLLPYILPSGRLIGIDNDIRLVNSATKFVEERKLRNIEFKHGNVYTLDKMELEPADITMCQQLLVNLTDPFPALEKMIQCTKKTGRILCVENINYGAYIHRPDFSWKTNLRMSQIWQKLCIVGKFAVERASTVFGAQLPELFDRLGLFNIEYQILNPSSFPSPPYSQEFITSFLNTHQKEKNRLKILINEHWAKNTDISEEELNFFIENVVDSDYDIHAVKNNLYLTQWFYPLIVIVGWLSQQPSKPISSIQENIDINFV